VKRREDWERTSGDGFTNDEARRLLADAERIAHERLAELTHTLDDEGRELLAEPGPDEPGAA